LRSQLAPGYALRKLAPQPTRTRTNNPEEWESTEHLGLDSAQNQDECLLAAQLVIEAQNKAKRVTLAE
jgi:hypothetical protein